MKATTYRVKFFSDRQSRAGKGGVRVAYFVDKVEADKFAATKRLYSKPAKAELVGPAAGN